MPAPLTSPAPARVRSALVAVDCALDSLNAAARELATLDPMVAARYVAGLLDLGAAQMATRRCYHTLAGTGLAEAPLHDPRD